MARANEITPSANIHRERSDSLLKRLRYTSYAIHLSLVTGIFLLFIKGYAYFLTASVAVLSDAAESVVHFFIMCFAAYSVRLARKPPDNDHLYGHDRISFFSVGFEGAMIVIAALFIFYESGMWLLAGDAPIQHIEIGIGYIALAVVINTALGVFLLRQGRRLKSLMLEANGRHVLADGLTSFGVIVGLALTSMTGWLLMDPIIALIVGVYILWSGVGLIRRSVGGLMDSADLKVDAILREVLDLQTRQHGIHYHFLRHRHSGEQLVVDFHLLFDNDTTIAEAHNISLMIESAVAQKFDMPVEITSHFEPFYGHDEAHQLSDSDNRR